MKASEEKRWRLNEGHRDSAWSCDDACSDEVKPQKRFLELREHLERMSWQTYIKSKYSNRRRRNAEEERG